MKRRELKTPIAAHETVSPRDHTVLPAAQQRRRFRHNTSRSRYSIRRPTEGSRLSQPCPRRGRANGRGQVRTWTPRVSVRKVGSERLTHSTTAHNGVNLCFEFQLLTTRQQKEEKIILVELNELVNKSFYNDENLMECEKSNKKAQQLVGQCETRCHSSHSDCRL